MRPIVDKMKKNWRRKKIVYIVWVECMHVIIQLLKVSDIFCQLLNFSFERLFFPVFHLLFAWWIITRPAASSHSYYNVFFIFFIKNIFRIIIDYVFIAMILQLWTFCYWCCFHNVVSSRILTVPFMVDCEDRGLLVKSSLDVILILRPVVWHSKCRRRKEKNNGFGIFVALILGFMV